MFFARVRTPTLQERHNARGKGSGASLYIVRATVRGVFGQISALDSSGQIGRFAGEERRPATGFPCIEPDDRNKPKVQYPFARLFRQNTLDQRKEASMSSTRPEFRYQNIWTQSLTAIVCLTFLETMASIAQTNAPPAAQS